MIQSVTILTEGYQIVGGVPTSFPAFNVVRLQRHCVQFHRRLLRRMRPTMLAGVIIPLENMLPSVV